MATDDDRTVPAIVRDCLAFFKVGREAYDKQREREKQALRFQVPELQWLDEVREQRKGLIVDGVPVPARPMLSISKIDQPVQLILNQERRAHLGIQIHPLSEDADDDTAEILQDIYRGIERDSRARLARSWAFDRSTKCGLGYYRILTEYDPTGHPSDQKILIKRILNQASVFLDPFAQEPDWCDGDKACITEDMPFERYKRLHPKSKLATMDADGDDSEFTTLMTEQPGWVKGDKASRVVRVCEFFRKKYTDRRKVTFADGETGYEDEAEGRAVDADGFARDERDVTIEWYKVNAVEVLEGPVELPGPYIPIIPVIGKELQPFDAERRWMGVIEPAMDAQRLFNYEISGAVEKDALAPISPWIIAEGQEESHEAQWKQANIRRFPYLRYKPTALQGLLVPGPTRNVASVDLSSALALIEQANDAIQATTFTPDPALGQVNPKDRSGKAIQALQQQSEAGNSGYVQNLSDVSLPYEARVVLSWMARYYDRPGRRLRVLGPDLSERTILINQPFFTDPKTKQPVPLQQGQPPPQGVKVVEYNLTKGMYGVGVTVGKSFETARLAAGDALGTMMQQIPPMAPLVADLWAMVQDWPGHEEVAERLKKMLPPQLQQQQDGEAPTPEQLQQQLQQQGQQMQQMGQQLQEAQQAVQTDQAKQQAQVQIAQGKAQADVAVETKKAELQFAIEEMKIKASLEEARIRAQAQITVEQIKAQMAGARVQFDAEIAREDRAAAAAAQGEAFHVEQDEAERQRQFEAEQAESGRMHEAEQATAADERAAQMAREQAAMLPPESAE